MIVKTVLPRYHTGEQIQRADEVEVFYPDLHGIPHRGVVHGFQIGPMGITSINVIHNSKRDGGVSLTSFADFSQGNPVNLRRCGASPQHADQIIKRAESAIHHPYHWWLANCEHFTDWCYTGRAGESDTKKAGGLVAAGLAAVIWRRSSGGKLCFTVVHQQARNTDGASSLVQQLARVILQLAMASSRTFSRNALASESQADCETKTLLME